MAQLGNTQREPSMEEILASIRRIIEDSDVQKPDEAALVVRPANDIRPASVAPELPAALAAAQDARLADHDSFTAAASEVAAAPSLEPSIVPAAANEDQLIAGLEFEQELAKTVFSDVPQSFELHAEESLPVSQSGSAIDLADWRLGVSDEAVINQLSEDDFDLAEVANAVLQELSGDHSLSAESTTAAVPSPVVEAVAPVVAAVAPAVVAVEPAIAAAEPAVTHESTPVLSMANNNEIGRSAIISDYAGRQVTASFNELAEAFAARNRKSLEEVAEDMMRPMLQDWLDNNLPTLVERLVREEIERVARGADA